MYSWNAWCLWNADLWGLLNSSFPLGLTTLHDLTPQLSPIVSAAPFTCFCESAGCLLQNQLSSTGSKFSTAPVWNIPPIAILLRGQCSTQALSTSSSLGSLWASHNIHSLSTECTTKIGGEKNPNNKTNQLQMLHSLFQMQALRDLPLSHKNTQKNPKNKQAKLKTKKTTPSPLSFYTFFTLFEWT